MSLAAPSLFPWATGQPVQFCVARCSSMYLSPRRFSRKPFEHSRPGGTLYLTTPQSWGLHYEPHDYFRFTKYGLTYLLEKAGFEVREVSANGGFFTLTFVRILDMLVTGPLFAILNRLGVQRGRYRLAALLCLPINLLGPVLDKLDSLDRTNVFGWVVGARRPETSSEQDRTVGPLLACPQCHHAYGGERQCAACGREFALMDGIPALLPGRDHDGGSRES